MVSGLLSGLIVIRSSATDVLDGTTEVIDPDLLDGGLAITHLSQRVESVTFTPKKTSATFVAKQPSIDISLRS